MPEDEEERSIMERLMRELLGRPREGERPSRGSDPGIYDFVSGSWRRVGDADEWRPVRDGLHVTFTDVPDACYLCSSGGWWYRFAEARYKKIWPHIEICERDRCADRATRLRFHVFMKGRSFTSGGSAGS